MSSPAVNACVTKTGDAGSCQTAALLGATDLQLESVTDEYSLNELLATEAGNPSAGVNSAVNYVPDSATYITALGLAPVGGANFLIDPDSMDALAQVVEPTTTAQAVDATVTNAATTAGSAVSSAVSAALPSISSFWASYGGWVIFGLLLAAVIAAIIINPQGIASAVGSFF